LAIAGPDMHLDTAVLAAHIVDAISLLVVIGLISGYHGYLRSLARHNPAAATTASGRTVTATWFPWCSVCSGRCTWSLPRWCWSCSCCQESTRPRRRCAKV